MNRKTMQLQLEAIKQDSFTSEYKASDAEAMGLLVSRYFEWDGVKILAASEAALEDANFHSECEVVHQLKKAAQRDFPKLGRDEA